jgi:hypothetical protein
MGKRQSIQPTYDSRETGPRYHVTYSVNGRIITWEERVPDPFVCAKVTVGFWDLLRSLWRGALVVKVHVDADADVVNDVMELDANTLTPNSTRRDEFNAGISDAIGGTG